MKGIAKKLGVIMLGSSLMFGLTTIAECAETLPEDMAVEDTVVTTLQVPEEFRTFLENHEGDYRWFALQDLDGDGMSELLAEWSGNNRNDYYVDVYEFADGEVKTMQADMGYYNENPHGDYACISRSSPANGTYDRIYLCMAGHVHTHWQGGIGDTSYAFSFENRIMKPALRWEHEDRNLRFEAVNNNRYYVNGQEASEEEYQAASANCEELYGIYIIENNEINRNELFASAVPGASITVTAPSNNADTADSADGEFEDDDFPEPPPANYNN